MLRAFRPLLLLLTSEVHTSALRSLHFWLRRTMGTNNQRMGVAHCPSLSRTLVMILRKINSKVWLCSSCGFPLSITRFMWWWIQGSILLNKQVIFHLLALTCPISFIYHLLPSCILRLKPLNVHLTLDLHNLMTSCLCACWRMSEGMNKHCNLKSTRKTYYP